MLQKLITAGPAPAQEAAQEEPREGEKEPEPVQIDGHVYESVEKLKASEEVLVMCASELAGVQIIKVKGPKVYLVSDKARTLAKHTLIGGFGTGKYVPLEASHAPEEKQKQVEISWEEGDKTLVQVDMSSLQADSTATEVMSTYKYLTMLERRKKVTTYDLSYTACSRESSGGSDGFKLEPKNMHCYRCLPDLTKTLTCKSVFWDCPHQIHASTALCSIFRWRYGRVNGVSKVQKPYVFVKGAFALEASKPLQVA